MKKNEKDTPIDEFKDMDQETENMLVSESEEDLRRDKKARLNWILFFSIVIILMIICVVVIKYIK